MYVKTSTGGWQQVQALYVKTATNAWSRVTNMYTKNTTSTWKSIFSSSFAAPTGVTASVNNATSNYIQWSSVPPDTGFVTYYDIYRNTTGVTPASNATPLSTGMIFPYYNDTGLTTGTLYYYWVRAYETKTGSATVTTSWSTRVSSTPVASSAYITLASMATSAVSTNSYNGSFLATNTHPTNYFAIYINDTAGGTIAPNVITIGPLSGTVTEQFGVTGLLSTWSSDTVTAATGDTLVQTSITVTKPTSGLFAATASTTGTSFSVAWSNVPAGTASFIASASNSSGTVGLSPSETQTLGSSATGATWSNATNGLTYNILVTAKDASGVTLGTASASILVGTAVSLTVSATQTSSGIYDVRWNLISGAQSYTTFTNPDNGGNNGTLNIPYTSGGTGLTTYDGISGTQRVTITAYSGLNATGTVVASGYTNMSPSSVTPPPIIAVTPPPIIAVTPPPIIAVPNAPTGGSVTITPSGVKHVGDTLTANVTNASGNPTPTYTYAWTAGGDGYVTVTDTGSTHIVTPDEQGYSVKVTVTFTNGVSPNQVATALTGLIAASPPPPPIIAVTPPIIAVTPPPIIAVTPPIIAVTPPIIAVTPPIIAVTPACRPSCPAPSTCFNGGCIA